MKEVFRSLGQHFKEDNEILFFSRHLLQLHHDDGGEQRRPHGCCPQLPSQNSRDARHANLGRKYCKQAKVVSTF